jgi:hypothetical protein
MASVYRFKVDAGPGVHEWTSEDYTLDEMCDAETGSSIKWGWLDPVSEMLPRRIMVALWLRRTMTEEEAAKVAGALRPSQMSVTLMEDDRPEQYEGSIPVIDPKAGMAE